MLDKIEEAYYVFVMLVIIAGILYTLYDFITTGSIG